jgi:hypothetical protein
MKFIKLLFISGFGFTSHLDKTNFIINLPTENNDIIKVFGLILLSLPIIYRNNDKCNVDDDCPYIMKCCQIGNVNYCCTPNNYIKLEYAYIKNYIR